MYKIKIICDVSVENLEEKINDWFSKLKDRFVSVDIHFDPDTLHRAVLICEDDGLSEYF